MTWLRAVRALRTVPPIAWAVAAGIGLAVGAHQWHTQTVDRAVANAIETDRAARASAAALFLTGVVQQERQAAAWKVAAAVERADSAWAARDRAAQRTRQMERQLAARLKAFDIAITALPDSLRELPQVTRVVGACTALAQDCAQLREEITRERAATDAAEAKATEERAARVAQQAVADSALQSASLVIVDLRTRAEAAERRPTWRRAIAVIGTSAAAGGALIVHFARAVR